jgi:hypothetical protein
MFRMSTACFSGCLLMVQKLTKLTYQLAWSQVCSYDCCCKKYLYLQPHPLINIAQSWLIGCTQDHYNSCAPAPVSCVPTVYVSVRPAIEYSHCQVIIKVIALNPHPIHCFIHLFYLAACLTRLEDWDRVIRHTTHVSVAAQDVYVHVSKLQQSVPRQHFNASYAIDCVNPVPKSTISEMSMLTVV